MRRPHQLCLVLLAIFAFTSLSAAARGQAAPDSGAKSATRPRTAWVDLFPEADGTTYPQLTTDFAVDAEPELGAALSASFGCPAADWQSDTDVAEGEYSLTARCQLRTERRGFQVQGQINLAPVAKILARRGVAQLVVDLHPLQRDFVSCDPPGLKGETATCRYQFDTSGTPHFKFAFGYRTSTIVRDVAILAAVLSLPFFFTLWLRRKALRVPQEAREAVCFAFLRYAAWGGVGGLILWWTALDLLGTAHISTFILSGQSGRFLLPGDTLSWFGVWAPPALVYVFCMSLAGPVHRLRGVERTRSEIVRQSLWATWNTILPWAFLVGGMSLLTDSPRASILCFFGWAVAVVFGRRGQMRATGLTPHALTTGALRDRAFALAEKARVKLVQVYVTPSQKMRMANAFAHPRQNILLTDYLLKNMSKREVDAIVGHELTHLQAKHGQKRAVFLVAMLLYFAATAWTNTYLPPRFPTGPLGILLVLLGIYFVSRRDEFAADAGAVRLTGDPQAMITALAKLFRLNTLPMNWHRLNEPLMTHPSVRRRISAIAKMAVIAPERVSQWVDESSVTALDAYDLPPTVAPQGKVFSTSFKSKGTLFVSWMTLAVVIIPPALVAALVTAMHWEGESRWLTYAVGFIGIALLMILIANNRLPMHNHFHLERELRQKVAAEGAADLASTGLFVGLAPGREPRLYENNWTWDVGLLTLEADRLVYWGEETRFTLLRSQILGVYLGPGPVNWWKTATVCVSWKSDAGTAHILNLRPIAAQSLCEMGKKSRLFSRDLQNWQLGRAPEPTPLIAVSRDGPSAVRSLSAPAFGEVSSRTLCEALGPKVLVTDYVLVGLIAAGVAVLFGLHFFSSLGAPASDAAASPALSNVPGWYVVFSAWALRTIHFFPYLRRPKGFAQSAASSPAPVVPQKQPTPTT